MAAGKPFRIIAGHAMVDTLIAAGIIESGELVRRVVIDIDGQKPVTVHVERWGDERLLEVLAAPLTGVQVRTGQPIPASEVTVPCQHGRHDECVSKGSGGGGCRCPKHENEAVPCWGET